MKENKVIESLLSEKRTALESYKKKVMETELEIRVLQEAMARLEPDKTKPITSQSLKSKGRGRKLDEKWRNVLAFIGGQDQASLDEITHFIHQKEYRISRSNLRVQLNSYTQKDWIRRVAQSTYVLTESGFEKIGYTKKAEPPVALATEGSNIEQESVPDRTIAKFTDRSLGTVSKMRSYN